MCTTMSNMVRSVLTSNYAGVSVVDCYTHADATDCSLVAYSRVGNGLDMHILWKLCA